MLFDLIIKSDRVVTAGGVIAAQVAVSGGRIVALLAPQEPVQARQILDATGLAVLPGAVDIHTHLREPGFTHKEDFASGTAAAAAGGWTTVIAQPNTNPPLTTVAVFREAVALGAEKAIVDFGVAAMATPGNVAELPALRRAGAALFEVGMADLPPDWLVSSLGQLAPILESGRATGTLVAIYANDQSLVDLRTQALQSAGRVDPLAPAEGRPGYAEAVSIAAVAELAGALGAQVHIRQVSTGAGAAAVARAKAAHPGLITAEVNPHHLFLTTHDAAGLGGWGRVLPPLRSEADLARLWQGLRQGAFDLISTDHAPHTAAEKQAGEGEIWKAASGLTVLETALPLLLDRVASGEITLEQVAHWTAEAPARRVGLFPLKGAVAIGAHADLVLAEVGTPWQVEPARFQSKAKWSPFAGRTLRGSIRATFVQGRLVYQDGQMQVASGGKFLF